MSLVPGILYCCYVLPFLIDIVYCLVYLCELISSISLKVSFGVLFVSQVGA